MLAAYKERFVKSLPPAQQAHVDFGRPVFLAAAFYLVARKHKVQVRRWPLRTRLHNGAQVAHAAMRACQAICCLPVCQGPGTGHVPSAGGPHEVAGPAGGDRHRVCAGRRLLLGAAGPHRRMHVPQQHARCSPASSVSTPAATLIGRPPLLLLLPPHSLAYAPGLRLHGRPVRRPVRRAAQAKGGGAGGGARRPDRAHRVSGTGRANAAQQSSGGVFRLRRAFAGRKRGGHGLL